MDAEIRIDARELDTQDLLKQLKERLSSACGKSISIEVLLNSDAAVRKVKAFVEMSGCTAAAIDKKDDYYIMQLRGLPCCT